MQAKTGLGPIITALKQQCSALPMRYSQHGAEAGSGRTISVRWLSKPLAQPSEIAPNARMALSLARQSSSCTNPGHDQDKEHTDVQPELKTPDRSCPLMHPPLLIGITVCRVPCCTSIP